MSERSYHGATSRSQTENKTETAGLNELTKLLKPLTHFHLSTGSGSTYINKHIIKALVFDIKAGKKCFI